MRVLAWSIMLSILLALCGCAQQYRAQQPQDQRQAKIDAINEKIKLFKRRSGECIGAIKRTDQGAIVYNEVLWDSANTTNKYELLSSKKLISTRQSVALKSTLPEIEKCRKIIFSTMNDVPGVPIIFRNYYSKNDIVIARLLSKSITIGEANQKIAENFQERESQMNEALRKVGKDIDAQYNQNKTLNTNQGGPYGPSPMELFEQSQRMLDPPNSKVLRCNPMQGGPNFGPTAGGMLCQ